MNATFPPVLFTIWWVGLIVTLVVFVPLAVALLHRTWKAARSIQVYAREALEAAAGIVANTAHVTALDNTISVAVDMNRIADRVEDKLDTVATVLARRAE